MIELILLIIFIAFVMEVIDSGLGMGYGTVLSPLLLAFGIGSLVVVPSILLSQAVGGLLSSYFHQKYENVDFRPTSKGKDLKIVLAITGLGVLATILAVFVAVNIPKWALNGYIGVIVLAMGIILLSGMTFKFSWKKMIGVGIISSFNKGLSGGGFGPVVTGGQVIAGQKDKSSIGCTTLAEGPICITGFIIWVLLKGVPDLTILIPLCVGAAIAAPFGAFLTKKIDSKKLRLILGAFIVLLGAYTLVKLFV